MVFWPTAEKDWELALAIEKASLHNWSFAETMNYLRGGDYSKPYTPLTADNTK
jgi:hypothetical protein